MVVTERPTGRGRPSQPEALSMRGAEGTHVLMNCMMSGAERCTPLSSSQPYAIVEPIRAQKKYGSERRRACSMGKVERSLWSRSPSLPPSGSLESSRFLRST